MQHHILPPLIEAISQKGLMGLAQHRRCEARQAERVRGKRW